MLPLRLYRPDRAIWRSVRDYFDPLNLYESMRPLVNTCSYMGFLPVYLTGQRPDRRFAVQRLFYVNGVLHMLLFLVALLRSIRTSRSLFSYFFGGSTITRISELFQLVTAFAAMGIVYVVSFANRYRFVAAVDALHLVDRRLDRELGIRQNYRAVFVWTLWNMLANVIVLAVYVYGCVMLVHYSTRTRGHYVSMSTFVSYFMPHAVLAQIVFKHRVWMRHIVRRAKLLNGVK